MRPRAVALLVAVAAAAGFLAGRIREGEGARGPARSGIESAPRGSVVIPVSELESYREREARHAGIAEENARLKARLAEVEPPATPTEELPPGSRRPDGSIVGGGKWSKPFVQTATGFIELMLGQFLAEANLTPDQEQRLRAEMRQRIGDALQLGADFTNGDLTGDEVYAKMLGVYEEAAQQITNILDGRQFQVYVAYEGRVKQMMQQQIVSSEMAGLRSELNLDPEQESKIKQVVEERWRRVQAAVPTAIPNILFKPVRREADAAIYAETATQIREWLRPEQKAAFDRFEKSAPDAPYSYRNMLLPRAP